MNSGLNIFKLLADASLPVQLVMAVLLFFSFMSWVIILRKYSQLKAAMQNAESFEERFWSGADLAQLFYQGKIPRQVRLSELGIAAAPVVFREPGGALARHCSGQKSRGHRGIDDHADVFALAVRQNVLFDAAIDH